LSHKECQSGGTAIRAAEALSRKPERAGALALKRSSDPNLGKFTDAVLVRALGEVPERLDEP